MIEFHCTDCDADFEVSPYYAAIEYQYDKDSCERDPYFIFWCPYCMKKHCMHV